MVEYLTNNLGIWKLESSLAIENWLQNLILTTMYSHLRNLGNLINVKCISSIHFSFFVFHFLKLVRLDIKIESMMIERVKKVALTKREQQKVKVYICFSQYSKLLAETYAKRNDSKWHVIISFIEHSFGSSKLLYSWLFSPSPELVWPLRMLIWNHRIIKEEVAFWTLNQNADKSIFFYSLPLKFIILVKSIWPPRKS